MSDHSIGGKTLRAKNSPTGILPCRCDCGGRRAASNVVTWGDHVVQQMIPAGTCLLLGRCTIDPLTVR